MPHIIEAAKTGRAKCRGCTQPIAAGVLRFGERVPNPFADDGGETTQWYHVPCAAFMRPESFLQTIETETANKIAASLGVKNFEQDDLYGRGFEMKASAIAR